jgi:hypothetical protein
MTLYESCALQQADGACSRGHRTPKNMKCVDFTPGIKRFSQHRLLGTDQ